MQGTKSDRIILAAVAFVAVGAVAVGVLATGAAGLAKGTLPMSSAAVGQSVASVQAAPTATTGTVTAAYGKVVVRTSCIGRCHGANLLDYRTSQADAQRVASSMGPRSALGADQQAAIALFLAQ
jgi:hypothetical protein